MLLKRSYKKDAAGELIRKKVGDGGLYPIVTGVKIKRLSKNGRQKFTPNLVKIGMADGWLEMDDTHITIDGHRFKILTIVGRYHVKTGTKLPDDPEGRLARAYITEHFTTGDEYICNNFYDCELEK